MSAPGPHAPDQAATRHTDVLVMGGGQAGLAAGYHLRRAGLEPGGGFTILDAALEPGGAWARMWPSLRAFSPPEYSSLPGWLMPRWDGEAFPPAAHVADYLARYEARYELPVLRPVRVRSVCRQDGDPGGLLRVDSDGGAWTAGAVISATGTWARPFVPHYPGQELFRGQQLHTAGYRSAGALAGQDVVVVGGGNSAAQLLAEISTVARTTWVTPRQPRFLPDDVDGRVLFEVATARRRALDAGRADTGGVASLGDIVMVPSVREARARGVLVAHPMFERLTAEGVAWSDGRRSRADTVLWCTGFRPALGHLAPLGLRGPDGHIATDGTRAIGEPRLHLLGYGDWTGPASATLIGVGRTARDAVSEIVHRGVVAASS
ncbi:ArsO family NAD(P)H-dependent flavin-containing monooxygenase [Oryzihumus sp.]|uniref:ArsO family NAD(P)H-dependent flavin-containing monooxygenase n=1 Tax=Oryzihumus sp. TaxID=1968903 RepID=UPI002EDB0042